MDPKPEVMASALARLIDAWPALPAAIKTCILAMVDATSPKGIER